MLSKVVFSCEYLYYIPWFFGVNSGTIFRGLWCYIPVMNYGTIFRLDADIWCYIPVVEIMVLYSSFEKYGAIFRLDGKTGGSFRRRTPWQAGSNQVTKGAPAAPTCRQRLVG